MAVRVGDLRHRPVGDGDVVGPGLPGRSIAASDSPVLSHHAVSVWWPTRL